MNLRSSILLAAIVVIVSFVSTGQSLQCHQCTSYTEAMCGDPFFFEDGQMKTQDFLKECPSDKEYTLCRKIYQNVRGDVRIIRSCGVEEYVSLSGEKRDCYKTVLEEYNTYVCTCEGDGCNGSATIQVSIFSVLFMSLLAALFK